MQSSRWLEWILDHPWVVEFVIVVFLLFFLNVLLKKILSRSKRKGDRNESDWRYYIDYVAAAPARVLLWILLFSFVADLLAREFKLTGFAFVSPLRNAGIIVCLAWVMLRWKRVFYRVAVANPRSGNKHRFSLDPFTVEMASKIFTILVIFISLLLVMSIFGLNIAPLVAFGGIGAAALGIAGKDVIANFFGGFMIYLTRPFMIGDQIALRHRDILGHVEEIGWYFTSIRDSQKQPIYIPNAVFSTEALINLSRMTHRRIEESLAIRYEDLNKVTPIVEEIRAFLVKHTSVDSNLPVQVFLEKFGDVAIHIEVKAYILQTVYEEFMEVRQQILRDIAAIILKEGAEIPFPTMQVKIQS